MNKDNFSFDFFPGNPFCLLDTTIDSSLESIVVRTAKYRKVCYNPDLLEAVFFRKRYAGLFKIENGASSYEVNDTFFLNDEVRLSYAQFWFVREGIYDEYVLRRDEPDGLVSFRDALRQLDKRSLRQRHNLFVANLILRKCQDLKKNGVFAPRELVTDIILNDSELVDEASALYTCSNISRLFGHICSDEQLMNPSFFIENLIETLHFDLSEMGATKWGSISDRNMTAAKYSDMESDNEIWRNQRNLMWKMYMDSYDKWLEADLVLAELCGKNRGWRYEPADRVLGGRELERLNRGIFPLINAVTKGKYCFAFLRYLKDLLRQLIYFLAAPVRTMNSETGNMVYVQHLVKLSELTSKLMQKIDETEPLEPKNEYADCIKKIQLMGKIKK
ncbi:MAG: hypothetical protein II944_07685 [Ruminobacter sp.]|nr:hypothetical protein [Ruminobacter sp.]